jgi:hypothetical protein
MRIQVNLNLPKSLAPVENYLPPQLVALGPGDVALLELQGALVVDGENEDHATAPGQYIGTLTFDKSVSRVSKQKVETCGVLT